MKIDLPAINSGLVRFDSLKEGDAFFTEDGKLAFRGQSYGHANTFVCLSDGAMLGEYQGSDLFEPCDVKITVTRRSGAKVEDPGLNIAERELVRQDKKIPAIKCYCERVGAGLREAKEAVEAFQYTLTKGLEG